MTEQEFVQQIVQAFESLSIPYFITGGMAAIAYGEPRFTNDLDLAVDLQERHIVPLLSQFLAPEFYVSEQAVRLAVNKHFQFNILHPASGNKVDVIVLSSQEYDRLRLSRKRQIEIGGEQTAFFASPEDVILKKLEYFQRGGSEKHLRDIASILLIKGKQIDLAYIANWAAKLHVTEEWQLVLQRIDGPLP